MNNMTLVIAWDVEQRGPLAARLAVDLRHARKIAGDLQEQYPWVQRISFLKEVDYLEAPESGPFLNENGWDVEWRKEQLRAEVQFRAEERSHEEDERNNF